MAPSRPAGVNYFPRLNPNYDYLCINSVKSNIKPESTQVEFVEQLKVEMQTKYLPHRTMDDLSTSLSKLIPGMAATMFQLKLLARYGFLLVVFVNRKLRYLQYQFLPNTSQVEISCCFKAHSGK